MNLNKKTNQIFDTRLIIRYGDRGPEIALFAHVQNKPILNMLALIKTFHQNFVYLSGPDLLYKQEFQW